MDTTKYLEIERNITYFQSLTDHELDNVIDQIYL